MSAFEKAVPKLNSAPLLVANANLSDMCLYAPSLVQEIAQRILFPLQDSAVPIVLTASTGPAALPWPAEIAELSVFFDSADIVPAAGTDRNPEPQAFKSALKRKAWLRLENATESMSAGVRALLFRMGRFAE